MKEKNSIDKWLESSFEQTAPVNPDALWESIAPSLPSKSNKRVLAWWLGAAIFTLGLGIALLLTSSQDSSIKPLENNTALNKTNQKKIESPKNANIQKDQKTSTTDNINNNPVDQKAENQKLNANKSNSISVVENKNTSQETHSKSRKKNLLNNTNKGINKGKEKDLPKDAKPTETQLIQFYSIARKISPSSNDLKEIIFGNLVTVPPFVTTTNTNKGDNNNNSFSSWTFGFSSGLNPSNIKSVIEDGLQPYVHQNYLKRKNEGESALFSGGFELYIRKHFKSFFIESGISRYQIGYNQNYNYDINLIPITSALFGNQPDANGRYPLDDQTPYIQASNPERISYSNKVSIGVTEIPLRLGYEIKLGKWQISPSFGAAYSFSNAFNAKTIDYQTLELIDFNELYLNSNTNIISGFTSLNIEYNLAKNLFIQAQPYYQKQLNNSSEVIQNKAIMYGINVGLNFKIAAK